MKKTTTARKLFAAALLASVASASQAAVVDSWDFVIDMKWDTSYGATKFDNATDGRTSVGTTEISWGADQHSTHYGRPGHGRSEIVISNTPATGSITSSFAGGTLNTQSATMFTHYNSEIFSNYRSLKSATMDVSLKLMLPDTGDVVENFKKSFEVRFYETPNVGGNCAWGSCSNDIFAVISTMDIVDTFTYGGVDYTLNYFETGDKKIEQLSAGACREVGFSSGSCYGFSTIENDFTQVKFNLSVTAVPEPETYAMLLAGLGVIGAVARRRAATRV
ncbi:MAG: THxN family PEP-CTERM protein [Azoarcus sp.]|nr:THxN family PEP-CTERM protein [Azoarcus sp.]